MSPVKKWKSPGPVMSALVVATLAGAVVMGAVTVGAGPASGRTTSAPLSPTGSYTLHPGTLEGDVLTLTGGTTQGNLTMDPGANTGFWFLDGKQITLVVQSGPSAGLVFEGKLKPKGINTARHLGLVAAGGFGVATWYGVKG
jgi:hypothetical protein